MNAQALHTAVVTVKYADPAPPDKKQATIKSEDGETFGVWPKYFGLFQKGRRYRIEYTKHTYRGRDYRTIVKAEPEEAPARPANPGATAAAGDASEFEFVTRILAASVQTGVISNTHEALIERGRMLQKVYRDLFG